MDSAQAKGFWTRRRLKDFSPFRPPEQSQKPTALWFSEIFRALDGEALEIVIRSEPTRLNLAPRNQFESDRVDRPSIIACTLSNIL